MKILLLSPYPERITGSLAAEDIKLFQAPLRLEDAPPTDLIVSYGYRHILRPPLVGIIPAVNLHISYLPWNRGADPNLWSWVDDTPKGATIHWIDEGIDTGPIIAQWRVPMGDDETLASSYAKLRATVEALFAETWPAIRAGTAPRIPQPLGGSFHRAADRAAITMAHGWDTPVTDLQENAI